MLAKTSNMRVQKTIHHQSRWPGRSAGRKRMTCFSSALYLVLLLPCFVFADNSELFHLINERLSYMDEVAAYKWTHKLPIEDRKREEKILDHAIADGLTQGIRVETSRAFFQQQITAAKEIQHYWFDKWRSGAAPSGSPDLNKVVRPELVRLGQAITSNLNTASPKFSQDEFLAIIDVEGLSTLGKQQLHQALVAIEHYDHRLQQVLEAGLLRVGTTGDYAPFSFRTSSDLPFAGIDIDLANDLAKALNVEVRFVPTQWGQLLDDLTAGRYDIAMSGVSRNLDRQKVGYFSNTYHRGGKTPISLCKKVRKFDKLQKIDRASNRIVVNPGGTNERYVDQHIKQAEKVLHQDNRTIFDEIISGNVDLMITDEIEVKLQSARHAELCPTMPGKTLTYQEKGYLMPQDQQLKEYVDLWLALRLGDGTVASTFEKHLN
ncbi:MAG: chorismate mutase AroQ, gamma subclass [Gammaproteobacteria bacterium]|jgi:cyclohexadienyl dehydratase|nr:chorismate mutase AroQ, gamma subclass [Gammaproteobacteria bacterium]